MSRVMEQNSRLANSYKKKLDALVEVEVKAKLKQEEAQAAKLTKEAANERVQARLAAKERRHRIDLLSV